jgi:hypothetical protein
MESNQTDIIVTACRVFSMISGGFLTVINAAAAFRFHFDGLPYAAIAFGIVMAAVVELLIRHADR